MTRGAVSRTFSTKNGSGQLERLLQMRLNGEDLQPGANRGLEIPVTAAKVRALQFVLPSFGLLCSNRLITSATLSSS